MLLNRSVEKEMVTRVFAQGGQDTDTHALTQTHKHTQTHTDTHTHAQTDTHTHSVFMQCQDFESDYDHDIIVVQI